MTPSIRRAGVGILLLATCLTVFWFLGDSYSGIGTADPVPAEPGSVASRAASSELVTSRPLTHVKRTNVGGAPTPMLTPGAPITRIRVVHHNGEVAPGLEVRYIIDNSASLSRVMERRAKLPASEVARLAECPLGSVWRCGDSTKTDDKGIAELPCRGDAFYVVAKSTFEAGFIVAPPSGGPTDLTLRMREDAHLTVRLPQGCENLPIALTYEVGDTERRFPVRDRDADGDARVSFFDEWLERMEGVAGHSLARIAARVDVPGVNMATRFAPAHQRTVGLALPAMSQVTLRLVDEESNIIHWRATVQIFEMRHGQRHGAPWSHELIDGCIDGLTVGANAALHVVVTDIEGLVLFDDAIVTSPPGEAEVRNLVSTSIALLRVRVAFPRTSWRLSYKWDSRETSRHVELLTDGGLRMHAPRDLSSSTLVLTGEDGVQADLQVPLPLPGIMDLGWAPIESPSYSRRRIRVVCGHANIPVTEARVSARTSANVSISHTGSEFLVSTVDKMVCGVAVSVSAPGWCHEEVDIPLNGAEMPPVVVTLRRPGSVRCNLELPADVPDDGVFVTLHGRGRSYHAVVQTRENRRFALWTNLEPGDYTATLRSLRPGSPLASPFPIVVSAGEQQELQIHIARPDLAVIDLAWAPNSPVGSTSVLAIDLDGDRPEHLLIGARAVPEKKWIMRRGHRLALLGAGLRPAVIVPRDRTTEHIHWSPPCRVWRSTGQSREPVQVKPSDLMWHLSRTVSSFRLSDNEIVTQFSSLAAWLAAEDQSVHNEWLVPGPCRALWNDTWIDLGQEAPIKDIVLSR